MSPAIWKGSSQQLIGIFWYAYFLQGPNEWEWMNAINQMQFSLFCWVCVVESAAADSSKELMCPGLRCFTILDLITWVILEVVAGKLPTYCLAHWLQLIVLGCYTIDDLEWSYVFLNSHSSSYRKVFSIKLLPYAHTWCLTLAHWWRQSWKKWMMWYKGSMISWSEARVIVVLYWYVIRPLCYR